MLRIANSTTKEHVKAKQTKKNPHETVVSNIQFYLTLKRTIFFVLSVPDIRKTSAYEDNRLDQNMSFHPYFDFNVPKNITARVGQSAFLNCRVEQLGDKSVSPFSALNFSCLLYVFIFILFFVFLYVCSVCIWCVFCTMFVLSRVFHLNGGEGKGVLSPGHRVFVASSAWKV